MAVSEHMVYMLKCKDGSLYTGYTNALAKRLKQHATGKGAKYTKGRGPFILVYIRFFDSRQAALREEYRIKQLPKHRKWALVQKGGNAYAITEKL
ncbi:GIY-YIG nuclease family protein [Terribacillus saccharophilus]|uniref:Endonuclease n=1 Tax=Terribacillus saccharophilus TaxID=361277 RepID=A0A268A6D9_9BACI|nr:GIY-YIG nuclease family protein [Terribacillus saccharophilus]PAD19700.1 endonuclease [Terribacillus saccharophilus]PAF16177.1 endonuclease [Terribacillus saccharophilus]PAF20091.1 endonuclease [Terribacillus saccharophilus]PAF34607.1 endonuclease [Terribacillus saccharophilus]PAF35184.1 endonuclease [Terribacillus saccharophilus]